MALNLAGMSPTPSIAVEDQKRDYMVLLHNLQVIGGEDEAHRRDIKRAIAELRSKHKRANAALYGSLDYQVLIATAGDACQVFAMGLAEGAALVPLVPEFEVAPQRGRACICTACPCFLTNSLACMHPLGLQTRPAAGQLDVCVLSGCQALLVQTVTPPGPAARAEALHQLIALGAHHRCAETPAPAAPLHHCCSPSPRPSPYPSGCSNFSKASCYLFQAERAQCCEDVARGHALVSCVLSDPLSGSAGVNVDVVLTLHNHYVKKVALVPREHLQRLVDVYTMLGALQLPQLHPRCERFQVIQPLLVNFQVSAG